MSGVTYGRLLTVPAKNETRPKMFSVTNALAYSSFSTFSSDVRDDEIRRVVRRRRRRSPFRHFDAADVRDATSDVRRGRRRRRFRRRSDDHR